MSIYANGATLASIAALMAISISAATASEAPKGSTGATLSASDKVHCYSASTCKMYSECGSFFDNSCKSENACSRAGFKTISAKECLDKGDIIADIKT